VLARIYNKSHQAKQKLDDAYFTLLAERNPDTFDPDQDVWRLEFQLRREGIKGFKLYAEPDAADVDAVINAELSAEYRRLDRYFRSRQTVERSHVRGQAHCKQWNGNHRAQGTLQRAGLRSAPASWKTPPGPASYPHWVINLPP
jgi:hypothetical protein